jgi:hypothetical protein
MAKFMQIAVLVVNFVFTVILCYLYDLNNWITDDKADQVIKTTHKYEGFWRICTEIQAGGGLSCEKYDEWIFSPKFPGWILTGRILIGLAIFLGYGACLGLLLGSQISTAVKGDTKKALRLGSTVAVVCSGAMCMTTGIYVFVMMLQDHQEKMWMGSRSFAIGSTTALIPSTSTYVAVFMGAAWTLVGAIGLCCSADDEKEEEGYGPGQQQYYS